MKVTWKGLLAVTALAAGLFYIGMERERDAEARQLSEADFAAAPEEAPVSWETTPDDLPSVTVSLPEKASEVLSAAAGSIPEAVSEVVSAAAAVINSWEAGAENQGTGYTFDKGTTSVKLPAGTESVSIANTNGKIEIQQGNVNEIQIHTTVVVQQATAEEAQSAADKAGVKVSEGDDLKIQAYSEPYGNARYPALELTVTLPQGMKAELQVETENGNLSLSKLSSIGKIKLSSMNGNITASGIGNHISLNTVNGNVHVSDAKESVGVSLTNGNVELDQIAGDLEVKTTNGNLDVKNALAAVEAVTVAGNICVESRKVGGDWKVTSSAGGVKLAWPEGAGVTVEAKSVFGEIETDFPLTVKNQEAGGKLGGGKYQIHAQSMAGLSLKKN